MHLIGLWKDRRALAVFLFVPIMLRCVVADWHLADNPTAPAFVRFWTKADNGGFRPPKVCPLMTQMRHWLCTAAMFLMSLSAPL
jgi:hypothetical protein